MGIRPTTSRTVAIVLGDVPYSVPTDEMVQHAQLLAALKAIGATIMNPSPTTSRLQSVTLGDVAYQVPTDPFVRHQQLLNALGQISGGGSGSGPFQNDVGTVGAISQDGDYAWDGFGLHVQVDGEVRQISYTT